MKTKKNISEMEKHFQLSDLEFEEQFENCTLKPSFFSHEAHLRLAWIHVKKYDVDVACQNICEQIMNFDIVHGKGDKFNKTVTIASVKAVNHFFQRSHSESFYDFIREFPRLKYNFKELLSFHYGFDIFSLERAKTAYLEPDLLPFD